ncbi:MAG: T9SS type A sorting domain-containing protein [Cytophagales bacterium]|nr:T9SS type A sorting domain-containing protein [Cytophagales bacterium]
MVKLYRLLFLALMAPWIVWGQTAIYNPSIGIGLGNAKSKGILVDPSLFNSAKSNYKNFTLQFRYRNPGNTSGSAVDLGSKSKGKWIATDGIYHFVPRPQNLDLAKGSILLRGPSEMPQTILPDKAKLYPIPNNDQLAVMVDLTTPSFSISIYDLIGTRVFKGDFKQMNDKQVFIPTDHLASGLYFLKVEWAGKTEFKSFTVQ